MSINHLLPAIWTVSLTTMNDCPFQTTIPDAVRFYSFKPIFGLKVTTGFWVGGDGEVGKRHKKNKAWHMNIYLQNRASSLICYHQIRYLTKIFFWHHLFFLYQLSESSEKLQLALDSLSFLQVPMCCQH